MKRSAVPAAVLDAFGASAEPVALAGGQDTTWRAGEMVVKQAGDERLARWTADVYSALSGPGFQVPSPVRSVSGEWVSGGWVAWQWLPGEPAPVARWTDLVAASRAFHAALANVDPPGWLGQDGSQWTVADQVAWGDCDAGPMLAVTSPGLAAQVRSLLAALRPLALAAQLVHGDLAGNVLFADGEPPAIIDFSPYHRPPGLAIAVAAVDVLMWDGASPAVLDEIADEPGLDQLLARALIGRLVTEIIVRRDRAGIDVVERAGQPVTDLLLARLRPASK